VDRCNPVKEETDEEVAEVPPCVGYGCGKDNGYECADKKNNRSVEYQVCEPARKLECKRETIEVISLTIREDFEHHSNIVGPGPLSGAPS
jgi:hypothetical protein